MLKVTISYHLFLDVLVIRDDENSYYTYIVLLTDEVLSLFAFHNFVPFSYQFGLLRTFIVLWKFLLISLLSKSWNCYSSNIVDKFNLT